MDHFFLNVHSFGYEKFCHKKNYVDKSGLIQLINDKIETDDNLFLVSRPRRFGKTYAAQMLKAYYTIGYDTTDLFKDKEIYRMDPSLQNRGAFDVIYIDMLKVRGYAKSRQKVLDERAKKKGREPEQLDWIDWLSDSIIREISDLYGKSIVVKKSLSETLVKTVRKNNGRKFVWICDEWDNFFREPVDDPNAKNNFIELLRGLFKDKDTCTEVFAAAYMTGILPMIKMKGESALTEFRNYTMFTPGDLAPYIGFTAQDMNDLLKRNPECNITYENLADWYEGYSFPYTGPIFNPQSVIEAIDNRLCKSYWTNTSSNVQFKELVSLQRDTLRKDVERLLQGKEVAVNDADFDNDLSTLANAGNGATLAAMVHLGYLSYDQKTGCAHIPNNEIRMQFLNMLKESTFGAIYEKIAEADEILACTLRCEEQKVADAFRRIHYDYADPKSGNKEATLKETVDLAYYTAERFYTRMYELPTGEGYADIILYPKVGCPYPLMIIELKRNDAVDTGLDQIKKRRYPNRLRNYGGKEMLLVGVSYDADKLEKDHYCKIERMIL